MKFLFSILLLFSIVTNTLPAADRAFTLFETGRRQFESGNYERAIDLFSEVFKNTSDTSLRNKSFYYQGLSLFEMGMYYSSYVSFKNVLAAADDKSREVYEKAIKNAVIITDKLDMVERIGKVIDKLPPSLIPGSVAGTSHYATGIYHFSTNNYDTAVSHLKSVNPESNFYHKALLYLGISATKKKNYKEALYYFQKLLDLTKGKREEYSLNELARLNLARTYYSAGDMEKSIEYYAQFLSTSPHWLTILLEASWPLMRVNDTTVSLGNLHTITSPFYREDLVGEGYILRSTILFQLCKYEEMKRTLSSFFKTYDPIIKTMQAEEGSMGGAEGFYRAYTTKKPMSRAFTNHIKRDEGINKNLRVIKLLKDERANISRFARNEQMRKMSALLDETIKNMEFETGSTLQKIHKRKLAELMDQREQASYLKVEVVTGEKALIENQVGLPPKRVTDVETSVASAYHFWPYTGEFWEDELGAFIYTSESSCVN